MQNFIWNHIIQSEPPPFESSTGQPHPLYVVRRTHLGALLYDLHTGLTAFVTFSFAPALKELAEPHDWIWATKNHYSKWRWTPPLKLKHHVPFRTNQLENGDFYLHVRSPRTNRDYPLSSGQIIYPELPPPPSYDGPLIVTGFTADKVGIDPADRDERWAMTFDTMDQPHEEDHEENHEEGSGESPEEWSFLDIFS